MKIEDGAIFIADAHYQKGVREELLVLLDDIQKKRIQTSQIFLMGDIFDLLVGGVSYTIEQNKEVIASLNQLSKSHQIIYLEGNHDFNLKSIFKDMSIYPLQKQPLVLEYHNKRIALSHGDNFESPSYKLYSYLIRNKISLFFLNLIDRLLKNKISKDILLTQKNKNLCKKSKDFKQKAKQKLKFYDITHNRFDLICEGHYHMDEEYIFDTTRYRFFPSYACGGSITQIHFKEEIVFNQI